ncbi:HD-GYP domain-containing protein [Aliiglaciecola sp. LCG003]|uniref:HD-GYP domain-containing protein n=1 Tax=Aliiglaciecola sp. LCG003 TaxID=3053655 RepID=UPI0025740818|nr:HD-GYP domain-containing protein [Aliiglaciecola sp. LCG003]WJG09415.1 HD-GYP domain-containing protein [Aliiglaciecola sp. LCG003]
MIKEISIDELKPGMYVQGIVEQRGNLKIKSQGKVTKRAIVSQLRKQGILRLLVDTDKAFTADPSEVDEADIASAADPIEAQQAPQQPEQQHVSFDSEITTAKKLHEKGKAVQRRMLNAVAKGLPIDLKLPEEFTEELVGSMDRNPNALMCLTKIREKDTYLFEHSLNVAILLANFAKYLEMDAVEVQELALAGFLHDIGKIRVPDEILHKPGKLTEPEMNIMRDHVYYGIQTLEEMGLPEHIIRTMAEHHERLDGYGYPEGLRGDEISQYGRMIAITDTYDAITADRVYKAGMPSQKALKILLSDSPDLYDRDLVQKFVKCVGVYSAGSLVKLTNGQIGMVVHQNEDLPLSPIVKVFYSARNETYLPIKNIDLKNSQLKIEKGATASEFGLDFNRFFNERIAI